MPEPFLPRGRFRFGANYWASHAGTRMWADWREDVVADDFRRLSAGGLDLLRVFPLWPDFQPIHRLFSGHGRFVEYRGPGDGPLQNRDGLDEEMVERFRTMCRLAREHGIDLIVGLVTGWMSGRLFVPPALEGRNPITDPESRMWQVRLCRGLIERLRDEPAVVAWDLGNECNALGKVAGRGEAYDWTALVAGTIKAADPARPLVSGMHSLSVDERDNGDGGAWRIADQGELTDVLTTHPYPFWVEHAGSDPTDTLMPILHAAAETRLYADIGGKPAFAEEIGSMGPTVCDDDRSADFLRASLWSLWQHDCRAALWWCAFDQDRLAHPPYEWVAVERQLGLFRGDGSAKPTARVMADVRGQIGSLPFEVLPPRLVDAAVVLTPGQDSWAAAYGAFALARQAGLDVRFITSDRPLPDVPLVIVPSAAGLTAIHASFERRLRSYIERGGRALLSVGDAHVPGLDETWGLHLRRRSQRAAGEPLRYRLGDGSTWPSATTVRREVEAAGAEVVMSDADGEPLLTRHRLGDGQAWLLAAPLETDVATAVRPFGDDDRQPLGDYYRAAANGLASPKVARQANPTIGMTEHDLGVGRVVVLVNAGGREEQTTLELRDGWRVGRVLLGGGDGAGLTVAPFSATVAELRRHDAAGERS